MDYMGNEEVLKVGHKVDYGCTVVLCRTFTTTYWACSVILFFNFSCFYLYGYETSRGRIDQGTKRLGYELTRGRIVHGDETSSVRIVHPGDETSWVRNVLLPFTSLLYSVRKFNFAF